MKGKTNFFIWGVTAIVLLILCVLLVYKVDPYFHYHAPFTESWFYRLDNERSQNDGIVRHFEYDAMITGTSMAENFKTSETDYLFQCNSIKVASRGGSLRETDGYISKGLESNPDCRMVIRCLDLPYFLDPPDRMREDLGSYPTWLYDSNPWNDVNYVLNGDVVLGKVLAMMEETRYEDFQPGLESFDNFGRWHDAAEYGFRAIFPGGMTVNPAAEQEMLSEEEKALIRDNVARNVTSTTDAYPNVTFYYFISPYSIAQWNTWNNEGKLCKMLEVEKYVTELILPHENVHLYSFHGRTDIVTNLNHYKDETHYAAWINSLILRWLHDGTCQLTEDNYEAILLAEYNFFTTFDYTSILEQEDFADDNEAVTLIQEELEGIAA